MRSSIRDGCAASRNFVSSAALTAPQFSWPEHDEQRRLQMSPCPLH